MRKTARKGSNRNKRENKYEYYQRKGNVRRNVGGIDRKRKEREIQQVRNNSRENKKEITNR